MSYFIRLIFKQKNTSHTEHVARPHKPNITSVWKDEIHKRIKRGLKVEVLRPVLLAITGGSLAKTALLAQIFNRSTNLKDSEKL